MLRDPKEGVKWFQNWISCSEMDRSGMAGVSLRLSLEITLEIQAR